MYDMQNDKKNREENFHMSKKFLSISMVAILSVTLFTGCGDKVTEVSAEPTSEAVENEIADVTATIAPTETPEPIDTLEVDEVETVETEVEVEEVETEDVEVEEVEEPKTSAKVEDEKVVETPAPVVETPAPHTHNHVLASSTSGANCTSSGVDTYTCECGDSYTTANNNYGAHNWTTTTSTETIHHDAVTEWVDGYTCDCGIFWTDATHPKYECSGYGTESHEVEVSPAYDETVTHTHTVCTNCGAQQ